MALLAHASLGLLGTLLLRSRSDIDASVLRLPLQQSALLTSLLAVPLLLVPGVAALVLAGYALWLAVLWLLVAVMQRSPDWFGAFQIAVSAAVVFAVSAVVPEWDWYDPYCLQAYGIGLGLLGLGWIVARMASAANPRVRELWEAPWPSLDRLMLGALVVGQFALALWGILPGLNAEMIPVGYVSSMEWPSTASHAYGWGAWALLGVLAVVLLAALREKGRTSILVGLLVLAGHDAHPRGGSVRIGSRHRLGAAMDIGSVLSGLLGVGVAAARVWRVWRHRQVSNSLQIRRLSRGRMAS